MEDGKVVFKTELETKDFDREIRHVEQELQGLEEEYETVKKAEPFDGQQEYLEQLSKKILKAKKNLNSLVIEKEKFESSKNVATYESMKNGLDKITSSAKKLALGIIGVSSAYSLIRKVASTYLSENEELTNKMASNWVGLSALMSGVIETIISGIKKLVTGVLYLAQTLTGVNYIAKANAMLLNRQAKATNNLTKANEKANASFDKFNKLNSPNNVSSGIKQSNQVDLFNITDLGSAKKTIEDIGEALKPVYNIIKDIVKFSIDHPQLIVDLLIGGGIFEVIKNILGTAGKTKTGLLGIMGTLEAIATIGIITIGIKLKNESDEFGKTLFDIRKDGEKIHKDFLEKETDINKIIENTNTKRKSGLDLIRQQAFLGGLLTSTTLKEALKTIKDISKEANENIKKEIELYNKGEKNVETQKKIKDEIYEQYLYNLEVIEALKKRGIKTSEIEDLNKDLIQNYKDMGGEISNANGKMTLLKDNSKITVEMDLNTKKAEQKKNAFWNTFTEPFRDLFSGIGAMFGTNKKTGGGGFRGAKGAVYYPKLALGGIINNPGQGIPYHGAIIGERGAEAVVPLTDSQQMELLGASIGKHVKVNVDFVAEIEGRVLARVMKEINNDNNFARNGG